MSGFPPDYEPDDQEPIRIDPDVDYDSEADEVRKEDAELAPLSERLSFKAIFGVTPEEYVAARAVETHTIAA